MNKEIKISIKSRWTGSILFEYSSVGNMLAKTVTEALKGGADLYGANLCDANLRGANLRGAYLREADLRDADLRGAYLCGADLCGVRGAYIACPTDGSFIGWKKASGYIVKLQIPEDARRSSAGGEKCRCDKAYVVEIQNADGTKADIEIFTDKGDVVIDPCAGSGTTLLAAAQCGRRAYGFEIKKTFCRDAEKFMLSRIQQKLF